MPDSRTNHLNRALEYQQTSEELMEKFHSRPLAHGAVDQGLIVERARLYTQWAQTECLLAALYKDEHAHE